MSALASALPPITPLRLVLVALAAAAGGAVNSIAGGGTLLTFPALVALGIPPLPANATSTVALWPGTVGSIWGYRRELTGARAWALRFAIPSVTGGLLGALLLLRTPPDRFAVIVPWLVFAATLLFVVQRPLMRLVLGHRPSTPAEPPAAAAPLAPPPPHILVYQFGVAVYGGYFGAGIGIFMLAALGFMGLTNIHRMNGLKNWGGLCINATAAITFAVSGIVNWPVALAMAAGAVVGGYGGSGVAQRVGQEPVRRAIVVIGFGSGLWLLARGV